MNTMEQVTFINELTGSVVKRLTDRVLNGDVPGDWDGHELRCLLAYAFEYEAKGLLGPMSKEYRRTKYGKQVRFIISSELYP